VGGGGGRARGARAGRLALQVAARPLAAEAKPAPALSAPEPSANAAPQADAEDAEASTPVEARAPADTGASSIEPPADAAGGCADAATPADREICATPALQALQRELRRAYAEALAAHRDRGLLRQRQLAWRDARNAVTDPARLAGLYEQRIAKLRAATAAARALQKS
jgi:uncharacterized protein YecT (DUF1311 family)